MVIVVDTAVVVVAIIVDASVVHFFPSFHMGGAKRNVLQIRWTFNDRLSSYHSDVWLSPLLSLLVAVVIIVIVIHFFFFFPHGYCKAKLSSNSWTFNGQCCCLSSYQSVVWLSPLLLSQLVAVVLTVIVSVAVAAVVIYARRNLAHAVAARFVTLSLVTKCAATALAPSIHFPARV